MDVHGSRWLRNRFGEAGGSGVCLVLIFTEWCEICYYGQIACAFKFDSPYLRTTESTSSRQPTVSATTANSAGDPPRSPASVSTEDRSGVGGSSDGQDEQSRIVLPPETGDQPSLLLERRALA